MNAGAAWGSGGAGPVCVAPPGLRSVSIPPQVAAACTRPLGTASCSTRTGAGSGARILFPPFVRSAT